MQNNNYGPKCIGNVIRIVDSNTILVNAGFDKLSKGNKIQVYEPVEMIKDINGNDLEYYNYV